MYKGYLKVNAVSIEISLGNVKANALKIIDELNKDKDSDVILFPELVLTGYSCGDLFFSNALIKEVYENIEFIKMNNKSKALVVFGSLLEIDGSLINAAIILKEHSILGVVPKYYLPNSGEYFEKRWFISGFNIKKDYININNEKVKIGKLIFSDIFNNVNIGIEICEDLWSVMPPSNELSLHGANVILNLSASSEQYQKRNVRKNIILENSRRNVVGYIYASINASDSTSEQVFSGHLLACETGLLLAESKNIYTKTNNLITYLDLDKINYQRRKSTALHITKTDTNIHNININFNNDNFALLRDYSKLPFVPENETDFYEIKDILEFALYKRLEHTNMKYAILGISGGLDSTLALLVTINTFKMLNLPLENIICVTMPGLGTSNRTKNNAIAMCEKLGVTLLEKPIEKEVTNHFELIGHPIDLIDVTYENTQARYRTLILMNLANKYNGLVIGTGDMSELALGWCTYNGDQMSMYSLNAGVPKTLVKYLVNCYSKYIFTEIKDTLNDILDTPISPELIKNQVTEDSVGKYEINDFIMYHYLNDGANEDKLIFLLNHTFNISVDEATKYVINFFKRFFSQQFKRQASPDGPKVLNVSLAPRGDLKIPSDIRR